MCKIQCLLAIFTLYIGLVNSWDIAITTGGQLEFYSNKTKTNSEGVRFRDLTALAYDAVHNMLLFVDKQNDNASIFSYHLATKKYQSLVRRKSYENIQGLAFDPVKGLLFWTDTNERSIYWMSLMPGSKNDIYGNLLIKMDDEIPRAIAVDSCRGYIYWTNINITKPTIERARFDGTGREIIIDKDIYMPVSIAVDQQTQKLYWADDREGIHYSIESADLDGRNIKTLYMGTYHQPNALAVSKDAIYWVDWGYKSVWKLPKESTKSLDPVELIGFSNEVPFGIVANYQIKDQTEGTNECEELIKLSQNKTLINDTFNIPRDVGLFCLHGVKVNGQLACNCSAGYTGQRCEISICHNYCFKGECEIASDGTPECRCNNGFKGERCEINICDGYCLNKGICSVDQEQGPLCKCSKEFEGPRCELLSTINSVKLERLPSSVTERCNCTPELNVSKSVPLSSENLRNNELPFVEINDCNYGWDSVRDPVIMILGIACALLCIACTVLVAKILKLKKRPRIKKRIIVNKNVTPLTARPDQCEITIENCCNMNICETPCFEPRSTIRPNLLDSKPGKEEKKTLINNMEYPEDY
ncbi:protein cueball isoform X1 [Galleria mellonella]|uniref:Protein cueball n=1 Tax=Galleria mellonella TaxID=7137 RepID=A0A6J1X7V0_GALME|nr:protein cueball isoform X1 [Galleria mellonella]